ncbi:L,D-transpeptidase [Saccharothrix xinjiangensis]|uniref:L,D-transpeptidase family protein n=1 Tax=Saccharothrix xinjiangensis TaxID=204798 RepID=A0ABV9XX91_9PSEU
MRKKTLTAMALLAVVPFLATACGTAGPTAAPSTSDSTVSSAPAEGSGRVAPGTPAEPTPTTTTPQPQPAPPPPPMTVPGTPCDIADGACVRLSTKESWLISDGRVSYGPVPITSGRPGHETPVGTFPVLWKVRDDWSRPYNAPMPFSTYFVSNGIAFHEGSLTDPSHGCVHLSREAASKYFEALQVGAEVQVTA